ncbi:MAG: peptide chain release factor N(5)-glutamine methyltransferase [Armatimonadota bacterium]|nr:peptide chain release factor N(5)-glutamine methyltransferase [Armatimonadota bacterium]
MREAWLLGREHLLASGVEAAGLEAEVLLRHVLGLTRAALYLAWERPLDAAAWGRFCALLEERGRGRPVAYLVGHREFMGLELRVDGRVLIPRPETEVLVEFLLHVLADTPAARVIDVGTGSGAIAVALARFLPQVRVLAVDISAEALAVARENAARHQVADRITFARGDLLAPAPRQGWNQVDAIASNPPYVDAASAAALPREVRDHEPAVALLAGADGTAFHARLAHEGPPLLRPGGWLVVEVGAGQAQAVSELFARAGTLEEIRTINDLAGIARVVAGRRR